LLYGRRRIFGAFLLGLTFSFDFYCCFGQKVRLRRISQSDSKAYYQGKEVVLLTQYRVSEMTNHKVYIPLML
jgi:hypothetical protein